MKERKSQGRGGGETSTVLEEKKLNPSETSDNRSFVENAESTGIFRKRDNDHGYHLEQTSTYSTDSQGPLMPILSFFLNKSCQQGPSHRCHSNQEGRQKLNTHAANIPARGGGGVAEKGVNKQTKLHITQCCGKKKEEEAK